MSEVVALLGHPVAHSLSPRMQNAAFAARGLDWTYVALDVEPERLEEAVRGLDVPGTEPLHQSQLESDNPYNTRKFAGLPPTPIGNPGLASMQAAAHPAKVDYLYFVRKPDKVHHYFTASFTDFQNHEVQYGFGK